MRLNPIQRINWIDKSPGMDSPGHGSRMGIVLLSMVFVPLVVDLEHRYSWPGLMLLAVPHMA